MRLNFLNLIINLLFHWRDRCNPVSWVKMRITAFCEVLLHYRFQNQGIPSYSGSSVAYHHQYQGFDSCALYSVVKDKIIMHLWCIIVVHLISALNAF